MEGSSRGSSSRGYGRPDRQQRSDEGHRLDDQRTGPFYNNNNGSYERPYDNYYGHKSNNYNYPISNYNQQQYYQQQQQYPQHYNLYNQPHQPYRQPFPHRERPENLPRQYQKDYNINSSYYEQPQQGNSSGYYTNQQSGSHQPGSNSYSIHSQRSLSSRNSELSNFLGEKQYMEEGEANMGQYDLGRYGPPQSYHRQPKKKKKKTAKFEPPLPKTKEPGLVEYANDIGLQVKQQRQIGHFVCPFNSSHVVPDENRLLTHIRKCKQKDPETASLFQQCRYNALHYYRLKQIKAHELVCPSKYTNSFSIPQWDELNPCEEDLAPDKIQERSQAGKQGSRMSVPSIKSKYLESEPIPKAPKHTKFHKNKDTRYYEH